MKRFATSSLSIATTVLMLAGGAFTLGQSQSMQLMSGDALLDHELNTRNAVKGQEITARLTQTIETPEGLKLPRGTELVGQVDQVAASHDRSGATLALTFDKARMKDGKEVPIKATLEEVGQENTIALIGGKVAPNGQFDQKPGEFPGVSMHSAVQSTESGTLTSKDKNIRLDQDTEMLIAVAPQSKSSTTGS